MLSGNMATEAIRVFGNDVQHMVDLVAGRVEHGEVAIVTSFRGTQLAVLAVYCVAFAMLFAFVTTVLLPPVAALVSAEKNAPARQKCVVSLRELVFYSGSVALHVWLYACHVDWVYPAHYDTLFIPPAPSTFPREMRFSHFMEMSWYITGVIYLFLDPKKKDFIIMLGHHLATLLLLTLSYQVSYTHAGATLILLHNVSDIFLQATKLAVYAGSSMLDIAFFVCLCLSWLILRLGCLPVAIYNAVDQYVKASEEQRREATVGAPILIGLMAALVPMHVYWFVLIIIAAKKSLSGEKLRDTREDTDGEGHPPDVAGTKKTQ